jgi:hypothetical protein
MSTTRKAPRKKLIFPLYLRPEQGVVVESAKKLDTYGARLKRPMSRSHFMREAVLMEAQRRVALAAKHKAVK